MSMICRLLGLTPAQIGMLRATPSLASSLVMATLADRTSYMARFDAALQRVPPEHRAEFDARFPADFICEAVDQTRGWFYTLHALSNLLHRTEDVPEPVAFRNVIVLGHILDGDGQKMSKSRGNVVNPWDVLNDHGADALRWYLYTASPPGNSRRFSSELVGETARRTISMVGSASVVMP